LLRAQANGTRRVPGHLTDNTGEVCGIRETALLSNRRQCKLCGLEKIDGAFHAQSADVSTRRHPDLSRKDFCKAVRRKENSASHLFDTQWPRKAILHIANGGGDRRSVASFVDGGIGWGRLCSSTREENNKA
jgi:hypothetical protein